MWYLQVDTLAFILGATLLYGVLAAVAGRIWPNPAADALSAGF